MIAVLVAAVAAMVVGALWYSPAVFGKQWMKLMGMTKKSMEKEKKNMGKKYLLTFISLLVTAFVLAHFVDFTGAVDMAEGMQVGFWAWLGFVGPATLINSLWTGKPGQLWALDNGHFLVVLVVMGAVLTTMA